MAKEREMKLNLAHLSPWLNHFGRIPESAKAIPLERAALWAKYLDLCETSNFDPEAFEPKYTAHLMSGCNYYPITHPKHSNANRMAVLALLDAI